MKNQEEILEVEIEMQNGEKKSMSIREVDDFEREEVKKGEKGLLILVNGQQFLITIISADYDGVSFKTIDGEGHTLHYEESVISNLFVEVQ